MTARKMTMADQALANACIFLAAQISVDDRTDMIIRELPDLAAAASRDLQFVAPLIRAAAEIIAAAPHHGDKRPPGAWASAQWTLRDAVANFAIWRCGLALDALRAAMPPQGAGGK